MKKYVVVVVYLWNSELSTIIVQSAENWKDAVEKAFPDDDWSHVSDDLTEAKQELFDGDILLDVVEIT